MASAISYGRVKKITLALNDVTDVGAIEIAKALGAAPAAMMHPPLCAARLLALRAENNTSVTFLSLTGNKIGDEGSRALAKALRCSCSDTPKR